MQARQSDFTTHIKFLKLHEFEMCNLEKTNSINFLNFKLVKTV